MSRFAVDNLEACMTCAYDRTSKVTSIDAVEADLRDRFPRVRVPEKAKVALQAMLLIHPVRYQHCLDVAERGASIDPVLALPGLIHDLGQLGVPDDVLLSSGQLSPGDWALMKRHPRVAFEMFKDVCRDAAAIMVAHHEYGPRDWYPRNRAVARDQREFEHLRTRDPSLERLQEQLSLADYTSALRQARDYKPSFTRSGTLGRSFWNYPCRCWVHALTALNAGAR